jgi:hypothetical protein
MAGSNTAWIDQPIELCMDPSSGKGLDQTTRDMAREMMRSTTREKTRSVTEEMAIEILYGYSWWQDK